MRGEGDGKVGGQRSEVGGNGRRTWDEGQRSKKTAKSIYIQIEKRSTFTHFTFFIFHSTTYHLQPTTYQFNVSLHQSSVLVPDTFFALAHPLYRRGKGFVLNGNY